MAAVAAGTALLAGCATGPSYDEVAQSFPPLRDGQGRVFFLRSASAIGSAIQPELRVDEEVVGRSRPGGFFFVDRPAGSYVAAGTTEVETRYHFDLGAGETKYLRSAITMGFLAGHLHLSEDATTNARQEMMTLAYTGDLPLAGSALAAGTAAPAPPAPAMPARVEPARTSAAPDSRKPSGSVPPGDAAVRMDDLRYLLPTR